MPRPVVAIAAVALIVLTIAGVSAAAFAARSVATPAGPPPDPTPAITAFSHAPDFSWAAGRLERSPLEGGFWVLRYQPDGATPDRYGGRFVLGSDPRLDAFRAGDLVVVHGRVAADQISIFMAGTIYEFDRIERL